MERLSSSKYELHSLHPFQTLTVVFGGGAEGGGGDRRLCLRPEKSQNQNTLNTESFPLGEDVQRTEEVPSVQCTLC